MFSDISRLDREIVYTINYNGNAFKMKLPFLTDYLHIKGGKLPEGLSIEEAFVSTLENPELYNDEFLKAGSEDFDIDVIDYLYDDESRLRFFEWKLFGWSYHDMRESIQESWEARAKATLAA